MRRAMLLTFLLFVSSSLWAGKERVSLSFDEADVHISPGREVSVTLDQGRQLGKPGEPDLPFYQVLVVLNPGEKALLIRVTDLDERPIRSGVRVKPYEIPAIPEHVAPEPVPTSPVYSAPGKYPKRVVELIQTGYFRGIPIAIVRVYPVRYSPLLNSLSLVRSLEFEVLSEPGGGGRTYRKQLRLASEITRSILERKVVNPEKLSPYLVGQGESAGDPFKVSLSPQPSDPPIAEVIVTTDEMAPAWEDFALYRTIFGVPTTVRTMSFIEASYPGADRAEKLRNFVIDAYQNWGILFLLLGGDAPGVPARIVLVEPPGIGDPLYTNFPSESYFGALDGNWNADGDTIYGENEDNVDFLSEVFVGRVPSTDLTTAQNYILKAETYESNPGNGDYGYLAKALFQGSKITQEGDGCTLVTEVSQHFADYFFKGFICEGENTDPTVEEFVDSLYTGYSFTSSQAHGNFLSFYISNDPLSEFTTSDADLMDNWWNSGIFHIVSCEPFGFDFDCVGEHMLRSQGSAVGILATTRLNWPSYGLDWQISFVDTLFLNQKERLGETHFASALGLVPDQGNSIGKYVFLSYAVGGDPSLLLWDSLPIIPQVTVQPESLFTFAETLLVTVKDSMTSNNLEGVLVTLYKEGEIYSAGYTNSGGEALFPLYPQTPGSLTVTLSQGGVLPKTIYVPVQSSPISLSLLRLVLDDADGDSIAEPEETLQVFPVILNSGLAESGAFSVHLDLPEYPAYLSVIKDTVQVSSLSPGDSMTTSTPLVLLVSSFPPDSYSVVLRLTYVGADTLGVDSVDLILRSPQISHYGHSYVESVDTFSLYISLRNTGGGDGSGVFGLLSAPGADFIVDSTYFGSIEDHSILPDTLTSPFVLVYPDSLSDLLFTLKIGDFRGIIDSFNFVIEDLRPPQGLDFSPLIGGIRIMWSPMSGPEYQGFFVYRSEDSLTGYERLNEIPLNFSYYEDFDVVPAEPYYYTVSVVDTFFNESPQTDPIMAYSSPQTLPGWPQYLAPSSATPLVADLDKGRPGLEILVGGDDGIVRLFDKNGNLLAGWPLYLGGSIVGSPAAGDIDKDGQLEIVVSPWKSDTNLVFVLEKDGTPTSGWPRSIPPGTSDADKGVYAPPVIADLDHDDSLEVIIRTVAGLIYVWKGNGEGFLDSTGFFFDLQRHTYSLSALSVGDINQDGDPEIVAATGLGTLHVLKNDATELPGFPMDIFADILAAPVVADFEPDSAGLEIVVTANDSVWLIDATGDVLPGWPIKRPPNTYPFYLNPSVADVDGDGYLDIVMNTSNGILAYDRVGYTIFQYSFEGGTSSGAAIADLDLDGSLDAFAGSNGDGIFGFNLSTAQGITGFPIPVSGSIQTTPALADVDSQGSLDLVVYSGDGNLWVFDLNSSYQIDSIYFPWPTHRHDIMRTGCFLTPQIGLGVSEPASKPLVRREKPRLFPVKPSPFSKEAQISFSLSARSPVSLKIYNSSGRLVRRLSEGVFPPGIHTVMWDGRDGRGEILPDGVYFVTLKTPQGFLRNKILRISR